MKNAVSSIAAIVFLAAPYKGSLGRASIGDIACKVASLALIGTNPLLLDALRLKTTDFERCQDSFSKLWRLYNFKVKTF
jgi:hypothetical protein